MDTLQWSQENRAISIPCGKQTSSSFPEKEGNKDEKHGINCRRCSSTNTKFCYYNNYSLSQPRYFCKTCKRYWTEGGSMRNIPVGGVSRKNMKRLSSSDSTSSSSSSSSSPPHPSSKKMLFQLPTPFHAPPPPPPPHQNHDIRIQGGGGGEENRQNLNLGLNPSEQSNVFKTITDLIQVPDFDKNDTLNNNPNNYLFMPSPTIHHQLGSFHDQEEDDDNMMRRRAAILFPFQEIKQVERKSSDAAAGGYRNNGGFLGSGIW